MNFHTSKTIIRTHIDILFQTKIANPGRYIFYLGSMINNTDKRLSFNEPPPSPNGLNHMASLNDNKYPVSTTKYKFDTVYEIFHEADTLHTTLKELDHQNSFDVVIVKDTTNTFRQSY